METKVISLKIALGSTTVQRFQMIPLIFFPSSILPLLFLGCGKQQASDGVPPQVTSTGEVWYSGGNRGP